MASFLLGIGALITNNAFKNRGPIGSPSPSNFLLAKLLDDGPALWILEKQCPERPYLLCTQLSRLQTYRDSFSTDDHTLVNYFLWGGPLADLGALRASVEQEARQIVSAALLTYPYQQFRTSAHNAVKQFFRIGIGNGLDAYSEDEQPSITIREVYGELIYRSYRASSQILGNLDFTLPNLLQLTLLFGSGCSLIGIILWYRRFDRLILYVLIFTAIFIIGNAMVTGMLSAVSGRYQSRVIWLCHSSLS